MKRATKRLKRPSRLRGWLALRDWTHADFGKALGIGASQVSLIISGKRNPSFEVALKIQTLTGISPRMLQEPPSHADTKTT